MAASADISSAGFSDLPKTTVSTSAEYEERAYAIGARAMLSNPIWRIRFNPDNATADDELLQAYHAAIKSYHKPRAARGAFVVEAGNWSVCALWWPPHTQEPPPAESDNETDKLDRDTIWSKYGDDFWQLGLVARDTTKPYLPGAVRAVLQPYFDLAAATRRPIWLKTTSEHAKDIYLHFGFTIVKEDEFDGHKAWAMIISPITEVTA